MQLRIGGKKIGDGEKTLIIAELSANHAGRYDIAAKTIRAMKVAGADGVKLQTYTPDTMTINSGNKYFKIRQGTIWDGRTLYHLYREAYTPWEWHPKLKKLTEEEGLLFFSTPFDRTSVDYLETLKVPAFKIASFEIADLPLIEYVASKGKPIILSTGVAHWREIKEAVDICRKNGNNQIAVLKCTSAYPAAYEEMNLRTMQDIKERLDLTVGVSDHSLGCIVPITAVALGASIVEKHFILDRKLDVPDAAFSLEPEEFKQMVKNIRDTEKALGEITYKLSARAERNRAFTRSLFAVKDIAKGDILTEENVRAIRPGYGLPSKYLKYLIGKRASKGFRKGTPLTRYILNNQSIARRNGWI